MLVRLIVGLCHEEAMKVGKSGLHRPRLVLSTSLLFCFLISHSSVNCSGSSKSSADATLTLRKLDRWLDLADLGDVWDIRCPT
mmetsp:Transcript_84976/g.173291  ORF Transcript_84976/g.173291 Transcript_84976/m.173291 type:complete len:83 (-) Transcript_84976:880-1128(-)